MGSIFLALGRSLRSLFRADIFWHLIWPGLLATVLWTGLAIVSWAAIIDTVMTWLGGLSWVGSWLNGSELAAGVVLILVKIAVALGFVPLIYLTAAVLVAVVALPMMLERVDRKSVV